MTVERNFLPTSDFRIVFGPTNLLRTLDVYALTASVPNVSLGEVSTPYRNNQGFVPGETLTFDTLNVDFLCDEKMELYEDIYNWMYTNTNTSYPDPGIEVTDIRLMVLNSHQNLSREILFINAFPTSLSGIELNVQNTDAMPAKLSVTFRYDKFSLVSPGVGGCTS